MHATPARHPGRLALRLLALAGALWLGALAALWFAQEHLLFAPSPLDAAETLAIAPDIHERFVDVPGARLSVLELRLPAPRGVVFYLHGNAGNLRTWFVHHDLYRRAGYDLVMMDYRGYGKSSGRIQSEAQLHADVRAVWDGVAARYTGRRVVIAGRSLGTGLAAALAARTQPDLTLLISPYSSMAALARQHYPWVPQGVLRYPLRTDAVLGGIHRDVMIIHGDQDKLIPVAHAHALQALSPRARLVVVPGAGHNDLQMHGPYLQALSSALGTVPTRRVNVPPPPEVAGR